MLIYNYQKEFLGIDEKDLRTLGFKDLATLRTEVIDFADLFVKTPGYVHNFKHVHWIDFITCAESSEESKVIINVNNKNFKCFLQIETSYLVDSPSDKAYIVNLNNLRELNATESERISGDITLREQPTSLPSQQTIFNTPEISDAFDVPDTEEETLEVEALQTTPMVTPDPYESSIEIDLDIEDETLGDELEQSINMDNISLDVKFDDDIEDNIELETSTVEMQVNKESFDNGYVYNPKVASDELGLPLDLIEEFIQDFIEQAKEFKENLYKAIEENDIDNLRILSHKLKGVAANLRIEDALETLTTVNTSDNLNIVEENLNTFYKIIAKLAGEEITTEQEVPIQAPEVAIKETPTEAAQEKDKEEGVELSFKDEDEDDLYADLMLEEPALEESQDDNLENEFSLELTEDETAVLTPTQNEYDKSTVASEIGLDNESFNELYDDYLTEATELTQTIESAIENNDLNSSKHAALKLKGMSDNMRITSLSDDLESIIYSDDIQEIKNSHKKIVTALAELSN